ncbi:hypothetical protein VSR69_45510 [Paraburkholderia phytofirmans]
MSDIENRDSSFDLNVALVNALLVKIVERKRLFRGEHVRGLAVARPRMTNGLKAFLATDVAHCCESVRIALAGDDRADDAHPSDACEIRDHMVQLDIHECQRLLHVLDVRGGVVGIPSRERRYALNSAISRPGRKLARSNPHACSRCSHCASLTSLFLPGLRAPRVRWPE